MHSIPISPGFMNWLVWLQQTVWTAITVAAVVWWYFVQKFVLRLTHRQKWPQAFHATRQIRQAVNALKYTLLPAATLVVLAAGFNPPESRLVFAFLKPEAKSAIAIMAVITTPLSVAITAVTIGFHQKAQDPPAPTSRDVPDWWHSDPY